MDRKVSLTTIEAGLLKEAGHHGAEVKAGSKSNLEPINGVERVIFTTGDPLCPYDIIPREGNKRVISLGTDAEAAGAITMQFSYNPHGENEQRTVAVPPFVDQVDQDLYPSREFRALIQFGTAGGEHHVELDIAEGSMISIHAQTCEVSFLNYAPTCAQINPGLGELCPDPVGPDLRLLGVRNVGSAGYLPHSGKAYCTQRVLCPCFVDIQDGDV